MPFPTPTFFRPLVLLLLAMTMVGCLAATKPSSNGEPGLVPPEPIDTACSFFYYSWGHSAELEGHLLEAQEAYNKALVCDQKSQFLQR